jgi:hypothetical protein
MVTMFPPTPAPLDADHGVHGEEALGGRRIGRCVLGQAQRTTRGTGLTVIESSASVGSGGPLVQPESASVARRAQTDSFVISR